MAKRILALLTVLLLIPLVSCGGKEGGDVLGLMYHHLTDNPDEISAWTTSPEELRANLTDLMELGYEPLSLEDYIDGQYDPEADYFIVTFDDGYRSNLTLAEPVLSDMHIPAAIFVVTGYVGMPYYMSWDDLREARDGGVFTLYSHTHSHLSASEVPLAEFLSDEKTAEEALAAQLGKNSHRVLSYPNGAFTEESMSALYRDGYDLFVIQDKPAWHKESRHGKILLRVNVPGRDADMKEIANFHRARCGVDKIP